jgi:adenosylmethionine-8-amino-7-oxononanoate aminotransferase
MFPASHSIASNTRSAVLHRDTHFIPKKAIGGKGSYIFLEDGSKFLDSTGGAAVSCLGHGHEKVTQAVTDQLNQLAYCHTAFFGTDVSEELARFLCDSTGGKLSKLYVVSSGRGRYKSLEQEMHRLANVLNHT